LHSFYIKHNAAPETTPYICNTNLKILQINVFMENKTGKMNLYFVGGNTYRGSLDETSNDS